MRIVDIPGGIVQEIESSDFRPPEVSICGKKVMRINKLITKWKCFVF